MGKRIKKGSRVELLDGRGGEEVCGEVFWMGGSRSGDGERYGVRGDDGETYWVDETDVQPTSRPVPAELAGPSFNKGDRIRYTTSGQEGRGTVFWIGKSRSGPGQRLGVHEDGDEQDSAVWLDAREAALLDDEEAVA